MRRGQRVHLKSSPEVAEALRLKGRSAGTVLCSYRVPSRTSGRKELLDVRLDSNVTLWGVAAEAFEESAVR